MSIVCRVLLGVALGAPAGLAQDTTAAVDVRVDPRIELLSIVFRLAGNPEYSQGRVASYLQAVDAHFAKVKDHAAVLHARRLRASRGVSFDAVAGFAVHLDGIDRLGEAVPFEPLPARLDARWTTEDARAFLVDLRAFVRDGKVAEFLAAHQEMYAGAEQAMRAVLAEHCDLGWFDRFFGARPGARFHLVLGLLNGGANYGPSVLRADGEELYCILGCWQTDGAGKPMFARTVVSTVVHEFCHSYCNPVVDAHAEELLAHGERMYPHVAAAMRQQAYGNARTLLCETLVRACVVRYVATTQGDPAAAAEVREQVGRSFLWTGELVELLAEYERARAQYPTLGAFVPRLAAWLADYVPRLEAAIAKKPKVLHLAPENGQQDVDPATKAIVVTFDRPMQDAMWSVVGGGEHFPKTAGKPSYDADRQVLTIPVELRPDWDYELWLNSGKFDSFRSADGEVLQPVHVRFKTRAK